LWDFTAEKKATNTIKNSIITSTTCIFTTKSYAWLMKINRIKEILVIKDISQKDFASKIGKSINSVSSICNNKSQPHLRDLRRMAIILDIDIRELLVSTKKQSNG